MGTPLRTLVTFNSTAFNTKEMKEAFINAFSYVDDFSAWFIRELRRLKYKTDDSPVKEDSGWNFTFASGDTVHDFIIEYRLARHGGEGVWVAWLERKRGFIGNLLGARKWGIKRDVAEAVHEILSGSTRIKGIRWHKRKEFDSGNEENGAATPTS